LNRFKCPEAYRVQPVFSTHGWKPVGVRPLLTPDEKQRYVDAFNSERKSFETKRLRSQYGHDPLIWAYRDLSIQSTEGFGPSLAMVLHLRSRSYGSINCRDGYLPIDREQAEETIRIFIRRVIRKVWGKKTVKKCKETLRSNFNIEKSKNGYLHANLLLELPEPSRMSREAFIALLNNLWRRTDQHHGKLKIQDAYDPKGWVGYGGKLAQKSGLDAYGDHIILGKAPPNNYENWEASLPKKESTKLLVA
jgi:hypothetical protein